MVHYTKYHYGEQIRYVDMCGACGRLERDPYKILFGQTKGKRPLGKRRLRLEENTRKGRRMWNEFTWQKIGSCGELL
jgi:hypothetical protein